MAKKKKTNKPQAPDQKAETQARIKRTEAYAERVRLMFATTVNQILALNRTVPTLKPGEMFSFDAQSKKRQQEVERLLRQLHSVATMAIQQGIKLEWAQANSACDQLVKSVFGQEVMSRPEFNGWTSRNTAAMRQFAARSEKGMNLSDRVWKSVQQLREEMEVAITVSIGEGQSAQGMSKAVRQYLDDPDLMFRRFRYKTGEKDILDEDGNVIGKKPIYGRKWKKRIKKPDGTYGWIDYDRDSYKTGPGVYKSAAKNAMRMTRTETNIAYRRADTERWQAMDFVLGQRVQMSASHPKKDICDKLAGDYPKDFVFDGWHPQCFCYVTPITIPPEETEHLTEMMLNGEDWRAELQRIKQGREITRYPDNFRQWVKDNADNIEAARARGTEPYFITNNSRAINNILNPTNTKPVTPQPPPKPTTTPITPTAPAAPTATPPAGAKPRYATPEERHAARTEADKADIIKRYNERLAKLEEASTLHEVNEKLATSSITFNEVQRLQKQLKEDEIISKIAGGDLTDGSCSSLAFTYAANRAGLDVRDFRGGDSCDNFSKTSNICEIVEKAGGTVAKHTNDYTKAKQLLAQVEDGKEYYFTCGQHAAIIRKADGGGYEFLELQSATDNGWKKLDSDRLRYRFGAKKSHTISRIKYETRDVIIDITKLRANYGFRRMMGYINTSEADQKKGASGTTK